MCELEKSPSPQQQRQGPLEEERAAPEEELVVLVEESVAIEAIAIEIGVSGLWCNIRRSQWVHLCP